VRIQPFCEQGVFVAEIPASESAGRSRPAPRFRARKRSCLPNDTDEGTYRIKRTLHPFWSGARHNIAQPWFYSRRDREINRRFVSRAGAAD